MKFSQLLLRAGLGLVVGFILSFASAIFVNTAKYTGLDVIFLISVPALAIAAIFFTIFPVLQKWWKQASIQVLTLLGILAFAGGAWMALPLTNLLFYMFVTLALTILLFAGMLPTLQFFPTTDISLKHYLIALTLSLLFGYGAVGFFDEVLKTSFGVFLFTFVLILPCNLLGYYLVRRAGKSFHAGFLRQPLNIFLCSILPILFVVVLVMSAQFPSMFIWEYITIPQNLLGTYFASCIFSAVWGLAALNQFQTRGYNQKFRATKLFAFVKENLPGLYAGGMFFLINLILARTLNHPAFSYNSVVFETDAGPWMTILGSPTSDAINRSVHPLVLITTRPLIRLLGMFLGDQWNLAPILFAAMLSGACVLMAYLFVKRATGAETYSFLFAVLLGSTSSHLLFGSLTENYVFGMTSLIFFFLLIQAGEQRFSRLVPMGVIVFGITVTNIAQTAIGLFFNKFGFWKTVRYCFFVVTIGVTLTMLTSLIYPHAETFFFVPADLAFEGNFVKPTYTSKLASIKEKVEVVTRTMFMYEVVAPDPLIVISQKKNDPFPTIDLKTFDWRDHKMASYKGIEKIPLALWFLFLAGAIIFFIKSARKSPHLPLMLGLLGSLGFNFFMHLIYGTELFLYTPYWVYALVFLIALAYSDLANRKWFEILLMFFVLIIMINNVWFIFTIVRALAPFFATS